MNSVCELERSECSKFPVRMDSQQDGETTVETSSSRNLNQESPGKKSYATKKRESVASQSKDANSIYCSSSRSSERLTNDCKCFANRFSANASYCGSACTCKCDSESCFYIEEDDYTYESLPEDIDLGKLCDLKENPLQKFEDSVVPRRPRRPRRRVRRGCRCKRCGCRKNYCGCFKNGRRCTTLCRCEYCQNRGNLIADDLDGGSASC